MGSQVKLTDAEKTRRLAEGCMGWKYSPETEITWSYWDGPRGFMHLTLHWQPLHNEAHAAEVRERMRELGWDQNQSQYPSGLNCAAVFKDVGPFHHVSHDLATTAICHAALLALGLAKEEEL